MEEDELLIEAASWANYYDRTHKNIQEIVNARIAEKPPQEVIDNPELMKQWIRQCEEAAMKRS